MLSAQHSVPDVAYKQVGGANLVASLAALLSFAAAEPLQRSESHHFMKRDVDVELGKRFQDTNSAAHTESGAEHAEAGSDPTLPAHARVASGALQSLLVVSSS